MRINRFLALAGLGSRRSVEELLLKGAVTINGSCSGDLGRRVGDDDLVCVYGKQVQAAPLRYLLLHKPRGYTCTRSDRFAEKTIFELLPREFSDLFHVGRLDKESEGLLLLTNDGELAQQLLHPSRSIDKEYVVLLDQPFSSKAAAALKKGIWIKTSPKSHLSKKTGDISISRAHAPSAKSPASLLLPNLGQATGRKIGSNTQGRLARVLSVTQIEPSKIKLILHQGLKRQIRIMLGSLGFKVKRLVRIRFGPLQLQHLPPGKYRELTLEEKKALLQITTRKKNVPRNF